MEFEEIRCVWIMEDRRVLRRSGFSLVSYAIGMAWTIDVLSSGILYSFASALVVELRNWKISELFSLVKANLTAVSHCWPHGYLFQT